MPRWTLIFLLLAVIAGAFGFGHLAEEAVDIGRVLFFIFLVMLVVSLVSGKEEAPPRH